MKKSKLMRKTALAVLVSSSIMSSAWADPIFDLSNTRDIAVVDVTDQFTQGNAFSLGSGSLTFRFKNASHTGYGTLLGVSDPAVDDRYVWFYTNRTPQGDTFGIEIRDGNHRLVPNNQLVTAPIANTADGYHTVTYTFDKDEQKIKIYVDGVLRKTANSSKFFEDIPGLNTAYVGRTQRLSQNPNQLAGNVFYSGVVSNVLSEDEIAAQHNELVERQAYAFSKKQHLGVLHTDAEGMFVPGQNGSRNYRIPSLLTTQSGVVIAAIDKRNEHSADWGDIDIAIRRSLDGGKTFETDQVIMDLVSQASLNGQNSALLIDAVMTQDKNTGRVFMLVDMFPESQALFGMFSNSQASFESESTGHLKVGDKYYRMLTDVNGKRFTLRDDNIVYNLLGEKTDYRVVTEGDPSIAFRDLGDIYQISTGNKVGNIFLKQNGSNANAPFKAHYTSYLWLTYSDDDGATWSSPQDITPQVKEEWMRFLGTGPGTGIQLKNGNLVLPVYFTNRDNKQSAALIISEDGGKTWKRGASPNDAYLDEIGGARYLQDNAYELTESQVIELDNGQLKMFSRNRSGRVIISTSYDGGMTWAKNERFRDSVLLDPYSQMSVIKYSKKIRGKEHVVFANPHASNRTNGMAWLGEVQDDGSIEWKYNTLISGGAYAYNSLTELPNGDVGLLYEGANGRIEYVRFNLQDLLWHDNLIYRDARNTENQNVSLDNDNPARGEVFYKIGDGEMIKVGNGINHDSLVVEEGIATLAQEADAQNNKQAYADVFVLSKGLLRLSSADQMPTGNIHLDEGTLDLNGNTLAIANVDETDKSGLHVSELKGNIVNHNDSQEATLVYEQSGNQQITGTVGEYDAGKLNLIYQPSAVDSALVLTGNSVLNVIEVKSGSVSYAPNTFNTAEVAHIRSQASLKLDGNVVADIRQLNLEPNARLEANILEDQMILLDTETVSGKGEFIKRGQGTLAFAGTVNELAKVDIQAGTFAMMKDANGKAPVINAPLTLGENTRFAGEATVTGKTIWSKGSVISPSVIEPFIELNDLDRSTNTFAPSVQTFGDVENQGTARIPLRVNNNTEDMSQWESDKVIITGDLSSTVDNPTSVDVYLLGQASGKSDTNSNGKYDANEGTELIRVDGLS
ncbi:exo-alpha-sialidase [Conservatibacter flavescens]|uniref:exo-alpha-sialidase n=1 Tax=Conservatibacter flavescens TaxID=28161 RepID=A0A2M8S0L4_9PAST|nr:exo-alpha-sialidase [Conservatibacter flavescens]PJG84689.1 hypothetical protein CVP05_10480 [Conservatibacter flavescens]